MKNYFAIGALIAATLFGAGTCSKNQAQSYTPNIPKEVIIPVEEPKASLEVKIASFNIQIFGESKREKLDVMEVLEKIVKNFDIVAVQEVRDDTNTTLPSFVQKINEHSKEIYAFIASPRLGRTQSKEQYAFIFNSKVKPEGDSYVYNDINDDFEREPYIAYFESNKFSYILVNIHTKPTDARKEIYSLVEVIKDASQHYDDKDVIVLGDFNADGSYFSEKITDGLRASSYVWAISDELDTTVAENDYTYDRIVFQKLFTSEDFTGMVGIFRFDTEYSLTNEFAHKISDHYPVWAEFYTNKDTD